MMSEMLTEQETKSASATQLNKGRYESPQMLVYGPLITLARGSGSGDTDGCSSGHYDDDE